MKNKKNSLLNKQNNRNAVQESEPVQGTAPVAPGTGATEEGPTTEMGTLDPSLVEQLPLTGVTVSGPENSETNWSEVNIGGYPIGSITLGDSTCTVTDPKFSVVSDCIYIHTKMIIWGKDKVCNPYEVLFTSPVYFNPVIGWENLDNTGNGRKAAFPTFSKYEGNWVEVEQKTGNQKCDCIYIKSSEHEEITKPGKYYFETTYIPFADVKKMFTNIEAQGDKPYKFVVVIEVESKDNADNWSPGTNKPERFPFNPGGDITPPPPPPPPPPPSVGCQAPGGCKHPTVDSTDDKHKTDCVKGCGAQPSCLYPDLINTDSQHDKCKEPRNCNAPRGCKHTDKPVSDKAHDVCKLGCNDPKGCLHLEVIFSDEKHNLCKEERDCKAPRGCKHKDTPVSDAKHNECKLGCKDSKGCLFLDTPYTDPKHEDCKKTRGCNSKYGCKHPDKPFDRNIHSECLIETTLPNPGQPGEGVIPPYQPPTGEPGSGSESTDNPSVASFTITPHTPLEMSVGTPIILQIGREDKQPLTNLNMTSKEGSLIITQEHEDKSIFTIKSELPVNTEVEITADGFMPVSIPVQFLAINFTATPSKTKVREKEKFTFAIVGVRDTDTISTRASVEGVEFTVKSNQLVEAVYNKAELKPGQTLDIVMDIIVGGVKVSNTITVKPEIDILTLNFTPGKEAYFTDEMTLLINGTEEELSVIPTSPNIKLKQDADNKYLYKITVDQPTFGKINIKGPNVKFETVQVIFRDKKQLQVVPHTPLAVSVDHPIVLEVISRSGEDIKDIVLKPRNNNVIVKKLQVEGHTHLYEVRTKDKTKDLSDTLDIYSATDKDITPITQEVTFSLLNISIKQDQKFFRAKKLNTLTLTGLNDIDEVTATCDVKEVSINRSKFNTFEVVLNKTLGKFDTLKTVINFNINGHKYGQPVEFIPEFDTIAFNFFPDRQVKYTSEVTVEVQGAKGQVDLKTTNPAITIKRIGELTDNKFLVDSNVVTEAIITAYGTDVESKTFSINFVDNDEVLPMQTEFELTRVKSTQGTFVIRIKNVIGGGLTAKSPSFKIKPIDIVYRTDNVAIATFQLSEAIEQPVNTVVNFYREGKLVLQAPVEIRLPKPKEPFGCDKLSLQGYVTSTAKPNGISVSIPFLNKERDFICQGETEEFNKKITVTQMANRIVIKADNPCRGNVIFRHPDYIDSSIYVDFIEYTPDGPVIVEDKDALIQEAESMGLDYKNDMSVRYDPDDFIANIVSIRNVTDKEKTGYIFVNGSTANKTMIKFFTAYEKNHAPDATFLGAEAVARDNFNLYSIIKKTLHIADYYKFREEFLLIIQMFKTFGHSSLSLLRIYRFEERWKGSPQDLERYKLMTTFIMKYIEQNGRGMNQYVRPLRNNLPSFIVDNLDKFTGEEIYV